MELKKVNMNTKNKRVGDCVIRAIAYAMNDTWDNIYKELCEYGFQLKDLPNSKRVYSKYLEDKGWTKYKQPRDAFNCKISISNYFANNRGIAIVTVPGHMTVVEDNHIVDIWDCSKKLISNYWIRG